MIRRGQDSNHWVSFRGQGHYLPPRPDYTLNVNGERVKQKGYITDELTDYAIEWLSDQRPDDKPFFLYLSHKAVHANFTPAERHDGMLDDAPVHTACERGRHARKLQGQAPLAPRPAQQLARGGLPVSQRP